MTDQFPAEATSNDDPDLRISTVWDPERAQQIRRLVGSPIRDRKIKKEVVDQDVMHAYLALGGVERLIHEGNDDYKWFANRFIKPGILLPDEHVAVDLNYQILPAIPRSPLDGEYTDVSKENDDGAGAGAASAIPPESGD